MILGLSFALALLEVVYAGLVPWDDLYLVATFGSCAVTAGALVLRRPDPWAPWLCFAIAEGLAGVAAVVTTADAGPLAASAGEGVLIVAYGAAGVGIATLFRATLPRSSGDWGDAGILSLAGIVLLWEAIVEPSLVPGTPMVVPASNVGMALLDLALLVGLARLAVRPPAVERSFVALLLVLLVMIAADTMSLLVSTGLSPRALFILQPVWLAGYGALAAGAVHPAARSLRRAGVGRALSPSRRVVLVGASIWLPAAMLLLHGPSVAPETFVVLTAAELCIAVIASLRLGSLALGAERRAEAERTALAAARAALERLRLADEQRRLVIDLVPIAIFDLEPGGRLRYANQRFVQLTGAAPAPDAPPGVAELLHADDLARLRAACEAGAATGQDLRARVQLRQLQGPDVEVHVHARRIVGADGANAGWVGAVTESAFLDRAVSEGIAQDRIMQALVDQSPIGIHVVAADGRSLVLNHALREMLGVEDRDLDAEPFNLLDDALVADLGLREVLARAFAGEVVHLASAPLEYTPEAHRWGTDGSHRYVEETYFPVIDGRGHLLAVILFVDDVTDRERGEEERRRIELKLRDAEKLEALGILAGGIAHDFNNLLVPLMGHAGLARSVQVPGSEADMALAEVELAARRAADLAQQMLAYSGRGTFVTDRISVSALVDELRGLLAHSVGSDTSLAFDLAADLPIVRGDATQLRQLLLNLVLNASDALPGGSGAIVVRTALRPIDPANPTIVAGTVGSGRPCAVIEVTDTGVGMDRATLERIFDPFFSTKRPGRGLGLAAALGIVKGHGGALLVRTAPGAGTTFSVALPPLREPGPTPAAIENEGPLALAPIAPALAPVAGVAPAAPGAPGAAVAGAAVVGAAVAGVAPAAPGAPGAAVAGAAVAGAPVVGVAPAAPGAPVAAGLVPGGRILIVDDDASVRRLSRRVLERAGFEIVEVDDAPGAYEAVAASPATWDGILLDLTLPTHDGLWVLDRVREIRADLPVVVHSGWSAVEVGPRIQRHAMVRFLQKPYQPQDLVAAFSG